MNYDLYVNTNVQGPSYFNKNKLISMFKPLSPMLTSWLTTHLQLRVGNTLSQAKT